MEKKINLLEENGKVCRTVGCGRFLGYDTMGTGNKRKNR